MNPTDTVSRLRRPRLPSRLRPLLALALTTAALAVLAFGGWVVLLSPWLAADKVAVAGGTTLSPEQVRTAAGVSIGTPLLRLDLDRIRDRVARLPAVQAVIVRRSWPHTVSIRVTERTPVAAIHRGGRWWEVDGHGVVFRETGRRDIELPVIAVPAKAGADALREAASVISSLPPDLLAATKRLTARSMDSITLRLKDKSAVMWGSAADSDLKVEVLRALLMHAKAGGYDVSVPGQPTTSK